MTRAEIDEYIHENLPSFEGWMPLLRELLDDLLKNGWNKSMVFTAKEKYGKFVLKTADVQLENFSSIIDEFEEKINKSCMNCGDDAELCNDGGWDYTYCLTHYLNEVPKINNISRFGFTIRGDSYYWEEIKKINGHPDWRGIDALQEDSESLMCLTLELNPDFFTTKVRERPFLMLQSDDINWVLFLKNIPNTILDTNPLLRDYISKFIASFCFCEICGKKALTSYNYDDCLLCNNSSWESMDEEYQEIHGDKAKYLKEKQLFYF